MAYMYYEGRKDFLVNTYPSLIMTYRSSGSIAAGNGVAFDAANTSDVYVPTSIINSTQCAGVALATVATSTPVPVLVFGVAKNLVGFGTLNPGNYITLTGSGGFGAAVFASGSNYIAGTVISGSSASTIGFMAFINVMK